MSIFTVIYMLIFTVTFVLEGCIEKFELQKIKFFLSFLHLACTFCVSLGSMFIHTDLYPFVCFHIWPHLSMPVIYWQTTTIDKQIVVLSFFPYEDNSTGSISNVTMACNFHKLTGKLPLLEVFVNFHVLVEFCWGLVNCQAYNIRHQIPKRKWFLSPLVFVFAQSSEARQQIWC